VGHVAYRLSCPRTPVFTMSSTSTSSSPSYALHRQLFRRCPRCSMGVLFNNQSTSCVPAYDAAPGTFWCSGLACLHRKLRGSLSTLSMLPIPRFSSRMSCFPRERCYGGPAVPATAPCQWLGMTCTGAPS
jgi:hypothetical protein